MLNWPEEGEGGVCSELAAGCEQADGIYGSIGSGLWDRHQRQTLDSGKGHMKGRRIREEKALGEQEIRRESPGEHESNEAIGEKWRAERMQRREQEGNEKEIDSEGEGEGEGEAGTVS